MKHLRPAIMLTAFFVALFGLLFPGAVWAVGHVVFPYQAGGSLIRDAKGNVVGSELIGQSFSKPEYFHPRPSAAGAGYDASSSSGTNLGPTSAKLVHDLRDLGRAYREENRLAMDAVIPADAATRSASGLDPDISPANARLQVARVAHARGLSAARVLALVDAQTAGRALGFIGEPHVNVLKLNLALDAMK
jgi:K+-transporting ATPase ATPase C chain